MRTHEQRAVREKHKAPRGLLSRHCGACPEGATYQLLRSGKALLLPGRGCRFVSMLRAMLSPAPADRPSPAKILASSLLAKRAKSGGEGGAKENYGALPFAPTQQQV